MQHSPQHTPFPAKSARAAAAAHEVPAGLARFFRPDALDLDDLTHAIRSLMCEDPAIQHLASDAPESDLPSRAVRGTYVMEARTPR